MGLNLAFSKCAIRDKLISLEEYLEDGGWEGSEREEWGREFLDGIDTSKDGFLDRAEVIQSVIQGIISVSYINLEGSIKARKTVQVQRKWVHGTILELWNSCGYFLLFKVRAWIVPVPGEFHASEAAHLVAAADKNGDNVLSKEEVDFLKNQNIVFLKTETSS